MANTPPTISDLVDTLAFLESEVNATPQRLDMSVTLADPDGNFDGGTVTLSGLYAADTLASDRFGIHHSGNGAGQIGVSGNIVSWGGVAIGTFAGGMGTALEITLNAAATTAAVEALIESLTYASVSDTPVATHNLTLNVRDADGADLGLIGSVTQLGTFSGLGSAQLSFQVAPAFVDYDNDGDADMFTGGDDGQVRFFRNNGDGSFTQQTGGANPINYDIGDGSGIAFTDMDGDGDRDAFVTSNLDGFAVRFRNNGNGTFTDMGVISGFYRGDDQNARTAFYDIDGDGDGDAIVGGRDGTLKAWVNNGNGTFSATGSHPFTGIVLPAGSFPAPSFADLDYDGDLDLALGNSNGYVQVYLNQGGVFRRVADESNPFSGVAGGQNASPALADIDGDGDADLVVGTSVGTSGQLNVWRNDGVEWGRIIHVGITAVNDAPSGADKTVAISEDAARRFTAADFGYSDADGNAFAGVRFTEAPTGGRLYYDADGAGPGEAVEVTGFPTATYTPADVAGGRLVFVPAADLNGAGAASIRFVVVDNGGTANGGADADPTPNTISFDIAAVNDGPVLTGLTASAGFATSTVATPHRIDVDVNLSDAEGNLANGSLTIGGFGTANQLAQDQLGINNQGSGAGQIGVSGNTVSYGGIPIGTFSGGANGTPLNVAFNGNATAEAIEALIENLTYANSSGAPVTSRTMLINASDADGAYIDLQGGFTDLGGADPFAALGSGQLSFQVAPAFLDYDNDGDADVFTGGDDGMIRAFRNNGNGSFTQLAGASNPFNGQDLGEGSAIAFVDLDGDGDRDAFVTEGLDGYAYRFTNNGNGTFGGAVLVSGFNRGSEQNGRPAAFDVNGDGREDLVVGGRDGTLKVWLNNGNGTVSATSNHPFTGIALPNGSFTAPAFGDFDGDGDRDLALGLNSGTVLWFENRGGIFLRADEADDVFLAAVAVGQNAAPALGDIDGDGRLDLIVGSTNPGLQGRLDAFRNDTGKGLAFTIEIVANLAVDDSYTINENFLLTGNLLANDELSTAPPVVEVNGQAAGVGATIVLASGARVTVNANGSFTYNPNHAFDTLAQFGTGASNQSATDSFTYRIGGGNVATVTLQIRGVYSEPHVLRGTAGNDLITGTAQDDRFAVSAGADRMEGGAGNDRYYVDNAGDVAVESSNNGIDIVYSSIDYAITGQHIEGLVLTGTAIQGTGNSLANTLVGNAMSNILNGGAGADTMQGGLGEDVFFVDNAADKVIEFDGEGSDLVNSSVTFSLAGQYVEVLNLTGAGAINGTGNGLANRLVGNSAANTLFGLDGNDRLDGGAGADRMNGGLGNDTYVVDNAADAVEEFDGQGNDTVEASIGYSLVGRFIETLVLTGSANINGTGNGLANTLIGNAGNNVLNGNGGADSLRGGLGNDTLIVDNAGDTIVELDGQGYDIVQSAVTFTLAGQFAEELQLTGSANINGTGNGLANTLFGNAGNNVLSGGNGDDALHGGLGSDTLAGGAGADAYWFETALGASNVDTINGFGVAEDTIRLDRSIFAGIAADGVLAAGAFRTGTAALDADDRILYDAATGNLWYDADGAGGTAAVLFAKLAAGLALANTHFLASP